MPIMPPTAPRPASYPGDRADLWRAIEALERRLSAPAPRPLTETGVVTSLRPTVRMLGQSFERDVWRVNNGAELAVGDEVVCVDTAQGLVVLSVVQAPKPGPWVPPIPTGPIWTDSKFSIADAEDYTFTNVNLGPPGADRTILVAATWKCEVGFTSRAGLDVEVAGVAAQKDSFYSFGYGYDSSYRGAAVYSAVVPAGTAATIDVHLPTARRLGINVWQYPGAVSFSGQIPSGFGITIRENGFAVCNAYWESSTPDGWTNATGVSHDAIGDGVGAQMSAAQRIESGAVTITHSTGASEASPPDLRTSIIAAYAPA